MIVVAPSSYPSETAHKWPRDGDEESKQSWQAGLYERAEDARHAFALSGKGA